MARAPLVTDYIEANSVPTVLAAEAVKDEEPIAVIENHNHHEDIGLVALSKMYHVTHEVGEVEEEAVVVVQEPVQNDEHEYRKYAHVVSSRYDFSEPDDIPNYLDRIRQVAEQQSDPEYHRDKEWKLREVDEEYAEYFEGW